MMPLCGQGFELIREAIDFRDKVKLGIRGERMGDVLLEVRYALRLLGKSPGFTVVALVTLMLGIGANVVVFGVLNAVLLNPLAVRDPASLYQIRHKPWMSFRLLTTSYPAFEDFRRRNTTFSGMIGIYGYSEAALRWRNATRNVAGDEVTGNYFDVLGVQPQAGRFFHATDEHGAGSAPYVVLSDALWRSTFQADRGVIGATVELNEHPFTVLGVTPARFHGTERFVWPEYWMPIVNEQQVEGRDYLQSRTSVAVTVIGRLKAGVTAQQATDNLNAIAGELAREYPQSDDGQALRLIHPGLYGDEGEVIRGFLYGVTLLGLLVLGAACANLASLFAARVTDRGRELALRVALGSSRGRLVRQLLIEALVVSLLGGAAGLVTADVLLRLLNRWPPAAEAHLAAGVDGRVYLVGFAMTLASALLFGTGPARQAWRSSPLQMMKGGGAEGAAPRRLALRDTLLGIQIAICTLLVTASLVGVQGMMRALHVPLGIEPRGALLADLDLSRTGLTDEEAAAQKQSILEAVRRIPGVTAAGTVNRTPMTGGIQGAPVFEPGTTEFKLNNSVLSAYLYEMSPGYLAAAGTRLLRGRDVSWHDRGTTTPVAIVNQTFARRMWRGLPVVGQHFIVSGKLTEVVGVVQDGKYHDLQEAPHAAVYVASTQSGQGGSVFVVRSQLRPSEMAAALGRTLSGKVPNAPITVQNWSETLDFELLPARTATVALGIMGALAAMLAVTGIFGMAAYNVSRRMKELGIRVALGAGKRQVIGAAVGRPMILLGAGSVVGLLLSVFAGKLLGQIVYQADPRNPLVVMSAVVTMALLGVLASAIPAARALGVDPATLMREE